MNTSRPLRSRSVRGFSLVELMVVVCIIGLLASIAVPQFLTLTWRTKRAERDQMRNAILLALKTRAQDGNGRSQALDLPQNPASSPSAGPAEFSRTIGDWSAIDFAPEGALRYRYSVAYTVTGGAIRALITILGDADSDGSPSQLDAEYVLTNDSWVLVSSEETLDDW